MTDDRTAGQTRENWLKSLTKEDRAIVFEGEAFDRAKWKAANEEKPMSMEADSFLQRAEAAEAKLASVQKELVRVNCLLALPLPERVERWRKEATAMTARVERLKEVLNDVEAKMNCVYAHFDGTALEDWTIILARSAGKCAEALAFCNKPNEEILQRGKDADR